jgi:MoaA/NifB/PqqE/SkfB family radical SAM enzyme
MSTTTPEVPADQTGRTGWLRGRLRWPIRARFAVLRFAKFVRILEVRYWRRWSVMLYYRHRDSAPPPSMVTLRMTNHCNLRCIQCAQWGDHGVFKRPDSPPTTRELSTEEWKVFIRRIAPYCPHIYFFGGEPFLRKDLLELVRCAAARQVVTGVNTNGHFLKGKGAEIVRSGMDYILISLDGPREVNNRIRVGTRDGYVAVVEGIEELIRARRELRSSYPFIELFMTLTVENQGHIVETAALARRLGVDYFSLALGMFTTPELARTSAEQYRREFDIDPKFYQGFVRDVAGLDIEGVTSQIREVKQRWGARYKQYPPVRLDLERYFRHPEEPLTSSPCIAPWLTMQILPGGDLAFCEDFADLVIGNIRTEDPLLLWNSARSRAWRRRIRTRGVFPAESRCVAHYL